MSAYRFVVFQGADGQWYWQLVAPNGEITAQSEGYTREADARRAIRTIKANVERAEVR